MRITMKNVHGHVEVYGDGEFLFSADDDREAQKELADWGCDNG